jgi:hypothetical protein
MLPITGVIGKSAFSFGRTERYQQSCSEEVRLVLAASN